MSESYRTESEYYRLEKQAMFDWAKNLIQQHGAKAVRAAIKAAAAAIIAVGGPSLIVDAVNAPYVIDQNSFVRQLATVSPETKKLIEMNLETNKKDGAAAKSDVPKTDASKTQKAK